VTILPINASAVALELRYWRETVADTTGAGGTGAPECSLRASPQYRGTWVFGTFDAGALAAAPALASGADVTALAGALPAARRFDGSCVTAPEMSVGAATSLYNVVSSGSAAAAADFLACLESGADPNTGAPTSAYAMPGDTWYGPGLLEDGRPAYDAHGWMHRFQFQEPGGPPACSHLAYAARLVLPADALPLSFFSARAGSLRDCRLLHCNNFTDYAGDELLLLVREHALLGPDDRITLIGFARQPHLLADRVPRRARRARCRRRAAPPT
jgi:hypothetical protein